MDDCRQIENLIYRYAEHIDNGELEKVADLFRNAVIFSAKHNSRQSGYEDVLSMYKLSCRLHEPSGTPLTKHLTTNVIIELDKDGEQASARSYYTVIQATDALPLQPIISGKYKDRFRKVNSYWEFSEREMIVDLIGNCSSHLLYDAALLQG